MAGSWQPQFSNNFAFSPMLAIANNDTIYSAFCEWQSGYPGPVSVMKFDGTEWVYVGTRYIIQYGSDFVSLATDSASIPYVAFQDKGDLNKLSVMKFNGSEWDYVAHTRFRHVMQGPFRLPSTNLTSPM